jgi:hypothetical protein
LTIAAGVTSLEICLSTRDSFFQICKQTFLAGGPSGGMTTFLNGFDNLTSLTLEFDETFPYQYKSPQASEHEAWADVSHQTPWIARSLTVRHWPKLESLVLRRMAVNCDTLVSFLRLHCATLRHVELVSIELDFEFSFNTDVWERVLECLRDDLSLTSVRISSQTCLNTIFDHAVIDELMQAEQDMSLYREAERTAERWVLQQPQPPGWSIS